MASQAIVKRNSEPQAGEVIRHGFGTEEQENRAETAAAAVAAREQAAVQARYVVAMQRPRNMDNVRVRLLQECERTGFAAVARYRKPVGKKFDETTGRWRDEFAEGFSIRFAEAAIRCMTNVYPEAVVVYESAVQRIIRFTVTDLESNVPYTTEVVINKTVERKKLKDGQVPISERKNSKGETTYLVHATDDDVNMKQASAWSKFIRNALRFVPGDILDECEEKIGETLKKQDAQDPMAAKKKIIDGFVSLGVNPVDIQAYLGHPLDVLQPKELAELRAIWAAIRDGEATWAEVMEAKNPTGTSEQSEDVAVRKIADLKAKQKHTTEQSDGGVQGQTAKDAHPAGTEREIPGSSTHGESSREPLPPQTDPDDAGTKQGGFKFGGRRRQ